MCFKLNLTLNYLLLSQTPPPFSDPEHISYATTTLNHKHIIIKMTLDQNSALLIGFWQNTEFGVCKKHLMYIILSSFKKLHLMGIWHHLLNYDVESALNIMQI